MREFVTRFPQRCIHNFVPRNFFVLLSPIHEKEKEIIAHFSQYAKVVSTHTVGSGSITLRIRATHKALRQAIDKLGNDVNAGHEEIKRRRRNEETNILTY